VGQITMLAYSGVDTPTLEAMKAEIEGDKKAKKIEDEFGERIYLRRKMYHFGQIIVILKKYKIFGEEDEPVYAQLLEFAEMRNRVHIENYHQNMEDREPQVFTAIRLTALNKVLTTLWDKMKGDFKRPW